MGAALLEKQRAGRYSGWQVAVTPVNPCLSTFLSVSAFHAAAAKFRVGIISPTRRDRSLIPRAGRSSRYAGCCNGGAAGNQTRVPPVRIFSG